MSVAGVRDLFVPRRRRLVTGDGTMALVDHLWELRARLLKATLVLVVGGVVAWWFYDSLFALLLGPYEDARVTLEGRDVESSAVLTGVANPLLLQVKICALAAVVLGSPLWLYQVWAFIVPGLHPAERRWARIFAVVAGPLFIVMLNLAGVLSCRALGAHRAWIIVGTFVFAAVATPSTDPFSMLALALPMVLLFLVSELLARLIDRRRHKAAARSLAGLADDQRSPLSPDDHTVPDSSHT